MVLFVSQNDQFRNLLITRLTPTYCAILILAHCLELVYVPHGTMCIIIFPMSFAYSSPFPLEVGHRVLAFCGGYWLQPETEAVGVLWRVPRVHRRTWVEEAGQNLLPLLWWNLVSYVHQPSINFIANTSPLS